MSSRETIVEDYLKAIEISVEHAGSTHFWPFGPGQVDSYFIDLLSVNLFEKFKANPNKFEEAASKISANVLRWFLLPFTILGLKLARNYEGYKVETGEMVDFIDAIRNVLRRRVRSEPFCLDGKNVMLSKLDVEETIKDLHRFETKERRAINVLSVDLESFVWTINFDIFAYGVFWHGPYNLDNKETLIIKKFANLDIPIWDLKNPYSEIEIFYFFDDKIETSIDFMSHLTFNGDIWGKLKGFAVNVNGKPVTNQNIIEKLSDYFSKQRELQLKRVRNLNPKQMIKKGIEIYYYMFRDLFSIYNESWRPPKKFEERIEEWGLKYWDEFKSQRLLKNKDRKNFIKKLYDPRNNFTD